MPSAGKGTLCARLAQKYGFQHISTGQILRDEQAKGSKLGKMATRIIDSGGYMPDDIMIPMVKECIISSDNPNGFLFDGFPRTKEQAKHLHAFLFTRKQPIDSVLFLDVKKNIAIDRILKRAAIENRPDDTKEAIAHRWHEYEKKTLPVVEFFSKFGLIRPLDANAPKDEVYQQAVDIIEELITQAS